MCIRSPGLYKVLGVRVTVLVPWLSPPPSPDSTEQDGGGSVPWHQATRKSPRKFLESAASFSAHLSDRALVLPGPKPWHPFVLPMHLGSVSWAWEGEEAACPPGRPPGSSQSGSRRFAPQAPRAQLWGRGSGRVIVQTPFTPVMADPTCWLGQAMVPGCLVKQKRLRFPREEEILP